MKKHDLLLIFLLLTLSVQAQRPAVRAYLDDQGQVMTEEVNGAKLPVSARDGLAPMPGFPLSFGSNTTYKPMRGLALADLNKDGMDEIILSHNDQLNVIDGHGLVVWSQPLVGGMAQYPPAIADLDNDGDPEIVALTAYGNARGGVNVFDRTGAVMLSVVTANNPLICSPVLADLDNDGQKEIIFCGRGKASANIAPGLHVWNLQGEELEGFPFEMPSTPAFTPTVADIDGDGYLEIFASTTSALYCISHTGETLYMVDGQEAYKYSYQSPLVVNFYDEMGWCLVGACHGDNPHHYIRYADNGEYVEGWPKSVAAWTYSAPTVVKNDDHYAVFMGVSGEGDVFYQYDFQGNVAPGFPLNLNSGIEGFISVADIDGDGENEIVTSFNWMDDGQGYIRAWEMDGTEVLEGFPLRPQGLTFMNGANFGDIDGDGNMEIVTLTYDQNFSPDDPVYVTAYALNQPVEQVVYGTYKGSNDRMGWIREHEPEVSCNPVSNLQVSGIGEDVPQVYLYWDEPELGSTGIVIGYMIQKDGVLLADFMVEGLNWQDEDVMLDETYEYVVIAVYDDGCEAVSEPVVVKVELEDVMETHDHLRLFPNPSRGTLYVEGGDVKSVEIFNVTGQKVLEQHGSLKKINVENLDNGIYFVRLRFVSEERNMKLFIEK